MEKRISHNQSNSISSQSNSNESMRLPIKKSIPQQ